MSAINAKAVYDIYYKESYIPLSETIARLNMLASFIENQVEKRISTKSHMISDDTTGRKDSLTECSIVECAAQTKAFNDIGLWMTSKESTHDRDFVPTPYPHFKTFYKLTYAPEATTQKEADTFHTKFFPMSVFFGLHPAVYKYLLSALNYEYDFGIFKYTIIHWLKSLEIPEVYWTTLNLEVKNEKYVHFGPIDVAKRIRQFVGILEQSPLTSSYEATYNMLDISEGQLESEANRLALKVKDFMKKMSILNFFANRSKAA
jgi:hypothetical protein